MVVQKIGDEIRDLCIDVGEDDSEITLLLTSVEDPLQVIYHAMGVLGVWSFSDWMHVGPCAEDLEVDLHGAPSGRTRGCESVDAAR